MFSPSKTLNPLPNTSSKLYHGIVAIYMIPQALQQRIESFITKYRQFSPIEIAQDLNINIVYPEVEDANFSGAIRKEDGKVTIFVNKADNPKRQLFTIAHELGHFFLHNNDIEKGIVSYRHAALYEKYSPEERTREEEANHFAAELLMPQRIFIQFYNQMRSNITKEDLIKKLAEIFEVNEEAIKVRMSYLDLN